MWAHFLSSRAARTDTHPRHDLAAPRPAGAQLRRARVAFNLYEHEGDHEGIPLLAGRAIAPARLPAETRRVTGSPTNPARLQLDHFLLLLDACEVLAAVPPAPAQAVGMDGRRCTTCKTCHSCCSRTTGSASGR